MPFTVMEDVNMQRQIFLSLFNQEKFKIIFCSDLDIAVVVVVASQG